MWPYTTLTGNPLDTPPPDALEPELRSPDRGHLFHYFVNATPAGILGNRMIWYQQKNDNHPTPVLSRRYGSLPPSTNADGLSKKGKSQNLPNLFDPATRRYLIDYSRDFATLLSRPVAGRPSGNAIHLWAMDNEWEGEPDYSPAARAAFIPWLEKNYDNNIDALNQAWRSRHRTFADAVRDTPLPAPRDYATNPGLYLDFMTFQTGNFTGLLADMAAAMRQADPLHRGIAHKSTQQTIEMPEVNRLRTLDHARFADLMRPVSGGYYGIDMYGHGDIRPERFRLLASDDNGKTWTPCADMAPPGFAVQVETPLFTATARHVRIEAIWPTTGGTHREIEFWGRCHPPSPPPPHTLSCS
ncbi:MAG: beta-galactosidase, partial [Opitutaceae bacterium]|nr:beta-galactosidase [Opitutaceae bacterium]